MSISMALLMAITRLLRRMTAMLRLHSQHPEMQPPGCRPQNHKAGGYPAQKPLRFSLGWIFLYLLVTTPLSIKSTSPSENISVCTPKSLCPMQTAQNRIRDRSNPHLQGAAIFDQFGDCADQFAIPLR
jgi:hypothetical protein